MLMKARTKDALQKLAGDAAVFSANTSVSAAVSLVSSRNVAAQAALFFGTFYGAMALENRIYRKTAVKKELKEVLRGFQYDHEQNDF